MEKQVIIFLATLWVFQSFGQAISIELSVEWKHEDTNSYSPLNYGTIPYLKIRYNNLTRDSIYFPKIYKSNSGLPIFPAGALMGKFKNRLNDFENITVFPENKNVFIGGMPPNNILWEVLPDSVDFHSEHEVGEINQLLSDIYESVYQHNEIITAEYATAITELQVLGEHEEDFIFLTSRSAHVEYYSLIGFEVVGGRYLFSVAVDEISKFLHGAPTWCNEQEKWIFKKVKLPEKAGDYYRYSGDFYTNKVFINF